MVKQHLQPVIETSTAVLSLIEDGIIHFQTKPHADFGLEEMLEVREANAKLSGGKPYCVIMEAGEFTTFSKEAKKASASKEHTKNRISLALIQDNMAMKLIVDLYMKLNKPVGPTKAFSNKADALDWTRKMRDDLYRNI